MDGNIATPASHAHEDDVPGTVYLRPADGDKTAYGQSLFPVPTLDPNDPVSWPNWRKYVYFFCICFFSLMGNASTLMPSVFFVPWGHEFHVPPWHTSDLQNYAILMYGMINLVWLLAFTIWTVFMALCSVAKTYQQLLAFSIVASIGSGICETISVIAIDDIFFLHERGAVLAYFTATLCFAGFTPLPAAYMLNLPWSWRSCYYLYTACGVSILILGFFFMSETHFDREKTHKMFGEASEYIEYSDEESFVSIDAKSIDSKPPIQLPKPYTFAQRLRPWSTPNHDFNLVRLLKLQVVFLACPAVLWTIIFYGLANSFGSVYLGLSFTAVITHAPWNWPQDQTGLNTFSDLVGVLIALHIGPLGDRFSAWRTRKNNGIREPEMRLWIFLPTIILSPVGVIVFSRTAYYKLHWFGFFAGTAIFQCANFIGHSILLTYMVDCYNRHTPELMAVLVAAKAKVSFGMGFDVLEWVHRDGFLFIGLVFAGLILLTCSLGVVFIIYGKGIRRWTGKWKALHGHKL